LPSWLRKPAATSSAAKQKLTSVVVNDSLISCPDHVQVWDISLAQLRVFGNTAAAAVDWARHGLTGAQAAVLAELWERGGELAGREEDLFAPRVEYDDFLGAMGRLRGAMQNFLAGPPGQPTGFIVEAVSAAGVGPTLSDWDVVFAVDHHYAPSDGGLARWSVRLGLLLGQPFLEYLIRQEIGGRPLIVRAQPSSGHGHPMAYVRWVSIVNRSAAERRRIHGLDAAELDPIVLVSNDWKAERLTDSVIAQLIEWHFRVVDDGNAAGVNCPRPGDDALAWWVGWARRAARNDEIGLAEAITVAKRSVRPATPAGHRAYWRRSLKPRARMPLLEQACGILGIGRSTAYERLKRSGRRASEFTSAAELVNTLRNHAPGRWLAADQRELIAALVENGMKPETARKLEYRTRHLSEQQRTARLQRAAARLRDAI
jgi:hypothetical protein